METIILVSVLSTIGVVAVLLSVAVALIKLRSKVDVNDLERQIRSIYESIEYERRNVSEELRNVHYKIEQDNNTIHQIIDGVRSNVYGHIDSRVDKLESKMKSVTPSEKDK